MLAVLHFGCLTYLSNPISVTIYTPDEQLVASKGLISLFKRFPFVKIVDAETHQFSWEDLDLIYDGECLINMYDDCLFSLSEIYGISSDRSHAHSITDYRNPHPLSILTANVITKRLTTEQCNYIKPELSPLYETSRKVVALSNRDPLWAGPGQPWRDTEISTLEPLISKLIHDGYFVVRINTVGKPSSISSPYFLDLATVDITAQDQLNIYKLMSLVIGGVSGVADWPRTFSLLPTLYLNSPVISVSNGFITGLSMVSTQYLRIIDEDVFLKTDTLFLVRLLLNSMWTPEWLASVGLEAQARSSRELLLEASEFLSSVSHQSACLTTHDLLDRFSIHRSHSSIPQPLTTSSHSILANILAAHESI
jgi:hypothetical protein